MRNHHSLTLSLRFRIKIHSCTFSSSPIKESTSLLTQEFSKTPRELALLLLSSISKKSIQNFRRLHAQIVVYGFHSDIFLYNLLLNGYSKSGNLCYARRLFDTMPQRNLISWSSIISTYNQHGDGDEALRLFSCFRSCASECPNEFILASVLRACVKLRATNQALQVHNFVIKAGFESDVYVGTALIDVYSNNGSMEEARLLFDDLPVKNAVTWTTIITGYSQAGKSETSLQLFNEMKETNVRPDRYVLSSVISACSMLEFLEGGKQIHGYVLRNGAEIDVSVNNVIVDFYSKCHRLRTARRVFDKMLVKNVVSWTTLIAGYMQNGCDKDAVLLFLEMNRQGWIPDGFTCTSILTSCGSLGALKMGKQVHSYTIKVNLESDDFVKNGLIDMYAKCDTLGDARNIFDLMFEHNVVSYNAMIEGYARNNLLLEALNLFNMMRFTLCRPSLLTFVSLLGVSTTLSVINISRNIHCLILKFGFSLDIYAGSSLVDVYSKCLCVDDARLVFDEMQERDIVVWNAMIFGYTQNGQGENAIKLFLELKVTHTKPNEFTFVAVVASASNLTSLMLGLQIHSQIVKKGFELEPYVSNALIDMYAKSGTIEDACRLFELMSGRDVVCWNSMISRFAQHGQGEEALKLFDRMKDEQIEPNYVTFVGVLSACSHVGLVEEGLKHFTSMKDEYGIEPGMDHYACVVDLLGRSQKLQDAKEFIENMPVQPAALVWRSFLGACRLVGDLDLGKYAAEMAIKMEPKDSGSHVLLSNIFASKGMWADVDRVRRGMSNSGVVKEPGYSWIEIKGKVHVFTVKDKAHRESDLIYFLLKKLTNQMQSVGYVPDSISVFVND